MSAQSIPEVIQTMERIMERSIAEKSAIGFFAGMYRLVTITVEKAASEGKFEDNERMKRLVVCFANRYLEAYHAYQNGENLSLVWWDSFTAANSRGKLILQHLFLGMNAHIHLDLGFSAVEVSTPDSVEFIKQDFLTINIILSNLINEVQNRLSIVSPLMRWVDVLGQDWDEKMAGFNLAKARDSAWKVATEADAMSSLERQAYEKLVDKRASRIAQLISHPPLRLRLFLYAASFLESRDNNKITRALWENTPS